MTTAPARSSIPTSMVEVCQLSVQYGARVALRDVSLTIPPGQVTALIGPSGCGKSSFLATLNRISDMIPECRVTGDILIDGQSIHKPQTDLIALRRKIGMVFQNPNPFPLSIRRNIEIPLKEQGYRNRREREEIIRRSLTEVGLWSEIHDRLDSSALQLAGGQQQRLCIARALALSPTILMFDEPCSALDPVSSRIVEDLIRTLRQKMTIIVVTHNLPQARRIADHVVMFGYSENCGYLVEHGSAAEFFNSPNHPVAAAYLQGMPTV